MTETATVTPGGALLYGVPAIARFLGLTPRQTYHLLARGSFPSWKEGKTVVARRVTVEAWIEQREAAGRQPVSA